MLWGKMGIILHWYWQETNYIHKFHSGLLKFSVGFPFGIGRVQNASTPYFLCIDISSSSLKILTSATYIKIVSIKSYNIGQTNPLTEITWQDLHKCDCKGYNENYQYKEKCIHIRNINETNKVTCFDSVYYTILVNYNLNNSLI